MGHNVKMANTSTYVSDGGAVTQNTVQGLAKAWFHIDGAAGTIALVIHLIIRITDVVQEL